MKRPCGNRLRPSTARVTVKWNVRRCHGRPPRSRLHGQVLAASPPRLPVAFEFCNFGDTACAAGKDVGWIVRLDPRAKPPSALCCYGFRGQSQVFFQVGQPDRMANHCGALETRVSALRESLGEPRLQEGTKQWLISARNSPARLPQSSLTMTIRRTRPRLINKCGRRSSRIRDSSNTASTRS